VFVRVIRYRWLPGHTADAARLARELVRSAQGQPGCRAIRVLSALDRASEGLVVFEWETRAALDEHVARASLERLAPWAVPLLQWRTDQSYTPMPIDGAPAVEAPA
jgi:quinol monooxygenase YgiN